MTSWMIFGQSNSTVTSIGVWLEYAFTKGLNGLIIVMMQTVVDERASGFCVVLINLLEQIMTMVVAPVLVAISGEEGKVSGTVYWLLSFVPYTICFVLTIIIIIKIRNMFRQTSDEAEKEANPDLKISKTIKIDRLTKNGAYTYFRNNLMDKVLFEDFDVANSMRRTKSHVTDESLDAYGVRKQSSLLKESSSKKVKKTKTMI